MNYTEKCISVNLFSRYLPGFVDYVKKVNFEQCCVVAIMFVNFHKILFYLVAIKEIRDADVTSLRQRNKNSKDLK